MGRSLYFDDEYRDVQHTLFGAFRLAQDGEWEDAKHEFKEAEEQIEALINLLAAVELGEVDPDIVEGLAHPRRWNEWCEVADLAAVTQEREG